MCFSFSFPTMYVVLLFPPRAICLAVAVTIWQPQSTVWQPQRFVWEGGSHSAVYGSHSDLYGSHSDVYGGSHSGRCQKMNTGLCLCRSVPGSALHGVSGPGRAPHRSKGRLRLRPRPAVLSLSLERVVVARSLGRAPSSLRGHLVIRCKFFFLIPAGAR